MKYKGLIFDFNGVLLWDNALQEEVWNHMSLKLRNKPFSKSEMDKHMHGVINKNVFEYLLSRLLSQKEAEQLTEEKERMAREMFLERKDLLILSPGTVELLNFLKEREISRTIATSSPKMNVDFFVEHLYLKRWFEVEKIMCDDGTFPGKPSPDIYLKAAQKLALDPKDCVVIEDAQAGIQAARAAGIGYVIALGSIEKHDLLRQIEGVKEVVTNLGEVRREELFVV